MTPFNTLLNFPISNNGKRRQKFTQNELFVQISVNVKII